MEMADSPMLENVMEEPSATKNIRIKKSRSGRTRAEIWKCSAELARAKPARNPAISMENPINSAKAATKNTQARDMTNKSSCERATLSNTNGRIFLPKYNINPKRTIALPTTPNIDRYSTPCPPRTPERITKRIMATKS